MGARGWVLTIAAAIVVAAVAEAIVRTVQAEITFVFVIGLLVVVSFGVFLLFVVLYLAYGSY